MRILMRLLVIMVVVLAAAAIAGVIFFSGLRSVADATARSRAIMAAQHEALPAMPTPAKLAASVVAVEDEHFYDNVAVNVLTGAGRAALAALQTSQDPGGSTLDQQLAKRLYGRGHGLGGTLREIGLGVKLALRYSKRQILQMYLNVNYYGHGFYGVRAAAEGYFQTAPSQLTWGEAAMLGGLLQAPSAYDPVLHYALARARQRHVLAQLVANRYLTRRQAAEAYAQPLPLTAR